MPKSLDTVENEVILDKVCYSPKNKHKRVLKSKENIVKPKCNRALKKKLKKYKLRRDGIEDPDILDVSKTLVKFLRIKSPSSHEKASGNNDQTESGGVNPGNYLMRMLKRKKACHQMKSRMKNIHVGQNDEKVLPILQDEVNDQKNMDVFKVMMDARNKSIGSNSPGKEKVEESELQDLIERKENRAKRMLKLQTLAVSKGSLKNKEIEEHRDTCVQKKMVKRAKRLKDMITGNDCKVDRKINNNLAEKLSPPNGINEVASIPAKNKSFKLCDIFDNGFEIVDDTNQSKALPLEDIEFLKKLSPSIKKKENMLSYFKKVSKNDCEYDKNNFPDKIINDTSVIKVKFSSKSKKNITKKISQVSESLHVSSETTDDKSATNCNSSKPLNSYKRCKRKHLNVEESTLEILPLQPNEAVNLVHENRPKRNVKKPIKYSEDTQIYSSDEEFHIFTPKKKKNNDKGLKSIVEDKKEKLSNETDILKLTNKNEGRHKIKCDTALVKNNKKGARSNSLKSLKQIDKKDMRLAPIFVAKMQLSPADIEAKQKFLKSGVPEKLKKKVQKTNTVTNIDVFSPVFHIQQNKHDVNSYNGKDWCNILNNDLTHDFQNHCLFKDLITLQDTNAVVTPVVKVFKPEKILKSIKNSYPKFPVYRTYNLLQGKSKGEYTDCSYQDLDNSSEIVNDCIDISNVSPDQLNWCDKYKPTSSKHIIGNFESIKEIKRWLETWTENLFKAKQLGSDSSDFSDFYNSDTDSRDTIKNSNNVLILTGQTGSGKTSSVYAVASELAIKVIEVNASSKRTGKIMLQDLQEATQSHKVDRGKSGSEGSQKLQEEIIPVKKKRGRPKIIHNGVKLKKVNQKSNTYQTKTLSQESGRTGMSLILVDDADIIFEQDDGFCSAISQLIQSSKRPVILITSSLSCPHMQRFLQNGKVLHMQPYLPRMLDTWLDIMCLTDVGMCCKGLGAKILDYYRGDIRKTINCLQFYMSSLKHTNHDEIIHVKYKVEDENSSMSWVYHESENDMPVYDKQTEFDIDKYMSVLHFDSSSDIFNVWWNLSSHYNDGNVNIERGMSEHTVKEKSTADISEISSILDTLSMIDHFDHNHYRETNITTAPWYKSESPSLLDNENFDSYNKSSSVAKDISDVLLVKSTTLNKYKNRYNNEPPSTSIQRNRDKLVTRHNKLSKYLNQSSVLDHHATALDYWSACRTICRIEKSKTDSNIKRNNRFCHYLKSLNVLCKNDFFDSLANSLS